MSLAGVPLLNDDPAFIAIGNELERIEHRRIALLRERYAVQGHVSLGGNVRPALGLCNISRDDMFDGHEPDIGDVVILGYLYGCDSTEVMVGRLAERYGSVAEMPQPDTPGYRFEWRADPIATYSFAPEGRGHDYRADRSEPSGQVGVDFIRRLDT